MKTITEKAQKRIGELLLEQQLITDEQLANALQQQRTSTKRLGQILISQKAITPATLFKTLMAQKVVRAVALVLTLIVLPCQAVSAADSSQLLLPVIEDIHYAEFNVDSLSQESSHHFGKYLETIKQVPEGLAKTFKTIKTALGKEDALVAASKGFHYKIDSLKGGAALNIEYRF